MGGAIDVAIVLSAILLPLHLGWSFLWPVVVGGSGGNDSGPGAAGRSRAVRILFSLSFALCADMLLLLTAEVARVLAPSSRWFVWRAVLLGAVALQAVLPGAAVYCLAADGGRLARRNAHALALAGEAVFLWLFWTAGGAFPILRGGGASGGGSGGGGALSLEGAVGRLGVLGVTAAAVLSGVGAISTPYGLLSVFLQDVSEGDIAATQRNLRGIVAQTLDRQAELAAAAAHLRRAVAADAEARRRRAAEEAAAPHSVGLAGEGAATAAAAAVATTFTPPQGASRRTPDAVAGVLRGIGKVVTNLFSGGGGGIGGGGALSEEVADCHRGEIGWGGERRAAVACGTSCSLRAPKYCALQNICPPPPLQ